MEKIIHRFWGGGEMPDKYKFFGEEWKRLNPDWEVKDWIGGVDFTPRNQGVLDSLLLQSQQPGADQVAYWTYVADILDKELVYHYGGFYFNTDIRPIRPLSEFFDQHPGALDAGVALGKEDSHYLVNAAMWAYRPGSEYFDECITNLPYRFNARPDAFMNHVSGAQLLTETYQETYFKPYVFGPEVFNYYHFTDFNYGQEQEYESDPDKLPAETIAVHLWGHRQNQRAQRVVP